MALVMARQAAMMRYVDATLAAGVKITNVARWCRDNQVNPRTFYRHRERIGAEGSWQPRSRRPKTSPGATPEPVAAEIVRLRAELAPDNGADAIIAALGPVAARQDWAARGWRVPHRSTVNKILKRAGLVKPAPAKRPRSSFRRFAYARPRDCYQLDATEVKLAGGGAVTVFEVLDDCTRLLAACQVTAAETAAGAVAAIRAAAAACGAPGIVLCDNGSAFTGGPRARGAGAGAFARAVTALGARLIHSSPYHPQTCGKVERHHQTLKKWLAAQPAQPATAGELQALLDAYRDYYNTRRHHTAVRTTPRQAWDAAESHGGPGRLPRQDDATIHQLTIGANGSAKLGPLTIHLGRDRAGQHVTAIRDHDRVTCYTPAGDPIGHLRLDHSKRYQGTLTPAA
jgi:transposase InsO family protein